MSVATRLRPDPAVAAGLAAVGGAAAGLALPFSFQIPASAVLAAAMAAIAAEDVRSLRVPDALNALAAFAGTGTIWLEAWAAGAGPFWASGLAILQGLVCGGVLLLLREGFYRIRNVDGLGLGDVKLGAVAGIWLGWELFAVAVTLAAFLALIFVAGWAARRGAWDRTRQIPFGAFLAPAVWACWYLARLFSFA